MKDRGFRRKWMGLIPFVSRIVLITLLFLVVPLLFYTYLLYEEESLVKKRDLEKTLRAIGEGQKALLEERIFLIWQFLDSINLDKATLVKPGPLPSGKSGYFVFLDRDELIVGREIASDRALIYTMGKRDLLYQLKRFEDVLQPIEVMLLSQSQAGSPGVLREVFPIDGSDFSLVLTASLDMLKTSSQKRALIRFMLALGSFVFIGGGLVYFFTRKLAHPLRELFSALHEVSIGKRERRYHKSFWGFEINQIGHALNQALDAWKHYENLSVEESKVKESLIQEIKIGHEIQQSLLPKPFLETSALDIKAKLLPAKEVGGDFYDFQVLKNGSLFFYIADTAGKGVSSCLYSLGLKSSLKAFASCSPNLSDILLEANNLLALEVKNSGMFITLWAGIYNPKTKVLEYASQGHVPALLKEKEKIEELATKGIALGVKPLDHIETKKRELNSKSFLLLCTDGITEAHNLQNQLFGKERLKKLFLEEKQESLFLENLLEEIQEHATGRAPHDDIALLLLQIF